MAFIFWRVLLYRKKAHAKPVTEYKCICIIDLANNQLLNAEGYVKASLADVQLQSRIRFNSRYLSSYLVLKWNKNVLTLVEGDFLYGGIIAVEMALIAKGIKRG